MVFVRSTEETSAAPAHRDGLASHVKVWAVLNFNISTEASRRENRNCLRPFHYYYYYYYYYYYLQEDPSETSKTINYTYC